MKVGAIKTSGADGSSSLILLVEDESIVREVTREVLQRAGYRVLECCNAQDALRAAQEHAGQIDLLLTDVVMPEMNGADLASRLLEMQPKLATVFMSGYAEVDVARKLKRSSAIHLQKPFTVQILLSRVAEALRTGSQDWREDAASVVG
jgi:CheY-like chemotaxis protein